MNIHAVIMAGGGGTRFWPRSRAKRPKQFLTMGSGRSLIQLAADRLEGLVSTDSLWVITGRTMEEQLRKHLPKLQKNRLVLEPIGRDTAACIALGAVLISQVNPDAVMVVTPADHLIEPVVLFQKTIQTAACLAIENPDALLTLGIEPNYPATGYGYIERGDALPGRNGLNAFRLARFKEKPVQETAKEYLRSGRYYWNSGIFVWKVKAILTELKRNVPRIVEQALRIADAWNTPQQEEVFQKEFETIQKISIDFAVMEHCRHGIVVSTPFRWDDVGSWTALERHFPQDECGNTVQDVSHLNLQSKGCLVVGDGTPGEIIASVGVENLVIVRDGNAVLVARKDDEAGIKRLVEQLKSMKRDDLL